VGISVLERFLCHSLPLCMLCMQIKRVQNLSRLVLPVNPINLTGVLRYFRPSSVCMCEIVSLSAEILLVWLFNYASVAHLLSVPVGYRGLHQVG